MFVYAGSLMLQHDAILLCPAQTDTRRNDNVIITSKRRRDVVFK